MNYSKTPMDKTHTTSCFIAALAGLFFIAFISASNSVGVQSGNIYEINVNSTQAAQHWVIFYGTANAGGSPNQNSVLPDIQTNAGIPGRAYSSTALYAPNCLTMADWLFVSNDTIHWKNLTAASVSDINTWAQIPDDSLEVADTLFQNRSVTIGDTTYINASWVLIALNQQTDTAEYVLKDTVNSNLVFALPLLFPSQTELDGTPTNFQMLVPRGPTYQYFANSQLCTVIAHISSALTGRVAVPAAVTPFSKTKTNGPLSSKTNTVKPPLDSQTQPKGKDEVYIPAGKTKHVEIIRDPKTAVLAEVSPHQTLIFAIFNIDIDGLKTLVAEFPFTALDLAQGRASVDLIKLKNQGHSIENLGKQIWHFEDPPQYQSLYLQNTTKVVWVVNARRGDVYSIKARIDQALSDTSINKTKLQLLPGNKTFEIFPATPQSGQMEIGFRINPTQSPLTWVTELILMLGLVTALIIYRHPWATEYLAPGKRGYLVHFFLKSADFRSKSKR